MLLLLREIKNDGGKGLFIMRNRKQNTRMTKYFQRTSATKDMCIQSCNTQQSNFLTPASLLHQTQSHPLNHCTPQQCAETGWWQHRFQFAHA